MKDYHINIFYSDEDEGYIADIPGLSHCSAFGKTPGEALSEALKAKNVWIESVRNTWKTYSRTSLSACNLPNRLNVERIIRIESIMEGRSLSIVHEVRLCARLCGIGVLLRVGLFWDRNLDRQQWELCLHATQTQPKAMQ